MVCVTLANAAYCPELKRSITSLVYTKTYVAAIHKSIAGTLSGTERAKE
jgi:hypothetical protein